MDRRRRSGRSSGCADVAGALGVAELVLGEVLATVTTRRLVALSQLKVVALRNLVRAVAVLLRRLSGQKLLEVLLLGSSLRPCVSFGCLWRRLRGVRVGGDEVGRVRSGLCLWCRLRRVRVGGEVVGRAVGREVCVWCRLCLGCVGRRRVGRVVCRRLWRRRRLGGVARRKEGLRRGVEGVRARARARLLRERGLVQHAVCGLRIGCCLFAHVCALN